MPRVCTGYHGGAEEINFIREETCNLALKRCVGNSSLWSLVWSLGSLERVHEVKTIFIIILRYYFLFHCVDVCIKVMV
jgi:hypothetical protein